MGMEKTYLQVIAKRFQAIKDLGDKTFDQLTDDDLNWSYNEASNSIAVIVKHLSGNMISRWTDFLTTDGEKANRQRDAEFETEILTKSNVITIWNKGWQALFTSVNHLSEEDLSKIITIRVENHTVIDAVERQLAHYAYHVGQIVYIAKQRKNQKWESLSIPTGKSKAYLQKMNHKQT